MKNYLKISKTIAFITTIALFMVGCDHASHIEELEAIDPTLALDCADLDFETTPNVDDGFYDYLSGIKIQTNDPSGYGDLFVGLDEKEIISTSGMISVTSYQGKAGVILNNCDVCDYTENLRFAMPDLSSQSPEVAKNNLLLPAGTYEVIKEINLDGSSMMIVLNTSSFNAGPFQYQEFWAMNLVKKTMANFTRVNASITSTQDGLPTEMVMFNDPIFNSGWSVLEIAFRSDCGVTIRKKYDANFNPIN